MYFIITLTILTFEQKKSAYLADFYIRDIGNYKASRTSCGNNTLSIKCITPFPTKMSEEVTVEAFPLLSRIDTPFVKEIVNSSP